MNPSDPAFAWLYAAELAACVREASRWDWDTAQRRLLEAVVQLSERLYEGAEAPDLAPLFEQVSDGLRLSEVRLWLAQLDPDRAENTMQRAREAFYRLRYHLFEEGPPLAA
ncbi:MAG: hypothetical protein JW785_05370 [Acidimicrobiia bacterium]|nr:hypothetical protein [Acidimicrobiia bacterium]